MRSKNHPVEEIELMAYLDGELSRERAANAAAHLENCRDCQALATELREISEKLAAWKVEASNGPMGPEVSAALEEHRRLQQDRATPRRSWGHLLSTRQLGFGALAVVVLVFLVISANFMTMYRKATPVGLYRRADQKSEVSDGYAGARQRSLEPLLPNASPRSTATGKKLKDQGDLNGLLKTEAPMVVRTANLAVVTREFDKARSELEEILQRHRGYLGQLNAGAPTDSARTLEATLRIPADQLDATVAELKKLGRVESESQSGEEVTAQYVDLEARLANARHTEQRLTDLLRERTGKLSDVLAVEMEINRVRGEIERMDAEKKELAKRVAFATINARLREDYKAELQLAPPSTSTRFRNAAVEGYQSVADGVIGLALFVISWGPSLLFWGALLFFPVRFMWRRFRRKMF